MKSWIANFRSKLRLGLIVPVLTIAMVGSFVTYDFVKAMPAKAAMAGPTATALDDNSVGALLSLDHAMETLAARVTPAIVNVTVTSRSKANRRPTRRTCSKFGSVRPVFWPAVGINGRSSRGLSTGWAPA